jgi:hypothetical protein
MFVIRSMSTTDFDWRDQKPVVPYHVYLMTTDRRASAWWSPDKSVAAMFETVEAAQAEIVRLGLASKYSTPHVAPVNDRGFPTFWDARKPKSK